MNHGKEKDSLMPKFPVIDSLRRMRRRPFSSFKAESGTILAIGEAEEIVVTYTSAVDKMKVFSAFIREGLENGDLVDYSYPDEESETVRVRLKKHGVNVEKYERESSLHLGSLTEYYLPNGKFDKNSLIRKGLQDRAEARRKGYKHYRALDDLGDFSFLGGRWQKYIDYWDDPAWENPSSLDLEPEILDYAPFVMELTAFDIESINEAQLDEMLRAFWVGHPSYTVFIDLFEYTDAFSQLLEFHHQHLVGPKFLLEFDPVSDYEKVVDRLAKESIANVEPLFIFTSSKSPVHSYLAKHPTIKFFLTSISTSIPKSTSDNKVLLPATNMPLILDALNEVVENHTNMKVCFVFDILSELLTTTGPQKAFVFLRQTLDMLSSEKITSVFLLNTSAHEPQVVSGIRGLFHNLLVYDKNGLEVVKTS